MKLTGNRTPDGQRIDDTEFTSWKYDSSGDDISPLEAAQYLPADESPGGYRRVTPRRRRPEPGRQQWYVDFAAVNALKEPFGVRVHPRRDDQELERATSDVGKSEKLSSANKPPHHEKEPSEEITRLQFLAS